MAASPAEWIDNTKTFVRETKAEMTKVTWPSRGEVIATTTVVLIAVIFFGAYLGLCDQLFLYSVKVLFGQFGIEMP